MHLLFASEGMDEESAFLRTIAERPDDDAARLIYADWLEQRGGPRCEFLRLTVEVRQRRGGTQSCYSGCTRFMLS